MAGGRFAEFTDVYQIEPDFEAKVEGEFNKMIELATAQTGDREPMIMARTPTTKTVVSLKHDEAKRRNIPTAEYQSVLQKEQEAPRKIKYPRNTDLDPQLVWRGKDEQDWSDLVVYASPALHPGKGSPQGSDR